MLCNGGVLISKIKDGWKKIQDENKKWGAKRWVKKYYILTKGLWKLSENSKQKDFSLEMFLSENSMYLLMTV